MDFIEVLQEPWAIRALIASTMVGITCGMLGAFIVLRNMSLIGDALSHAILPGVAGAFVILGYNTLGFFLGSVVAGLLSAVAITWIQQHIRTKNDAVIGIVFTAFFSIGVIWISAISRTGVHLDLKDFLFGNVLGVSDQDLVMTGTVMIFVILSVGVLYRYLFASTFQPTIAATMGIPVRFMHYYLMVMLSFAVVAAMQTVGVILVVAMLITPASTALLLAKRLPKVLLIATVTGFLCSVSGLILSVVYEMPPGPSIAVTATGLYLLAAFLAPEKGMIAKYHRRKQQEQKVKREDILKAIFKASLGNPIDRQTLLDQLSVTPLKLKRLIQPLISKKLLRIPAPLSYQLTDAGRKQANDLVRAHRLWESYLVSELGMHADDIHEEAERYEHILTTSQVDAVDKQLGYPALDPHGSPIPGKATSHKLSLENLKAKESGTISPRQPGAEITYKLWALGLGPGDSFTIRETGEDIILEVKDDLIHVPSALARQISVDKAS